MNFVLDCSKIILFLKIHKCILYNESIVIKIICINILLMLSYIPPNLILDFLEWAENFYGPLYLQSTDLKFEKKTNDYFIIFFERQQKLSPYMKPKTL